MARSALTNDTSEIRFSKLIKPSRDLAENWNINIAAYLEDYLIEIEKVSINFDGGKTTMNFAEAAMLIQGSAYVYSKKVEFLYNLVIQMVDFLHNRKKSEKESSEESEHNISLLSLEENEFTLIDDIEVGKNLDLKEENNQYCSFKFLPRLPACLLPVKENILDDDEISMKNGELIGKMSDFRMTTSIFNSSGLLLLAGYHQNILPNFENEFGKVPKTYDISNSSSEVEELYYIAESNSSETDFVDLVNDNSPITPEDSLEMEIETEIQNYSNIKCPAKEESLNDCEEEGNILIGLDPYMQTPQAKLSKKGIILSKLPEMFSSSLHASTRSSARIKAKLEAIAKHTESLSTSRKVSQNETKGPVSDDGNIHHKKRQNLKLKRKRQKLKLKPKQAVSGKIEDAANIEEKEDASTVSTAATDDSIDLLDEDSEAIDIATDENNDTDTESLLNGNKDDMLKTSYEELIQVYLEKRPTFDIHEYGTKVLERFVDNNRKQTIKFSDIVNGKEAWEIARYFASSLELANRYNVAITSDGKTENGIDKIEITLLSHKRHHKELQEYLSDQERR